MALKKKWRRELTPAEKRINFTQLEERWNSTEAELVDELIPVMNQVIARLEAELRVILDSEKYNELSDIKIGYKDKLVGIFKTHMLDAFKVGKLEVYDEFKIKKDFVLNAKARQYMSAKAEAVVGDMLDRIKANAIFATLNGIKAGFTTDQIIAEVKGPAFKQNQAEPMAK